MTSRRSIHAVAFAIVLALASAACGGDDDVAFEGVPLGSVEIVDASQVQYSEISPFAQFGPAQGDFTAGGHGTFAIFGAGASSPPHTHSGEYYAVVLNGEMNNPFGTETAPPTLGPGSFWAVPASDEHVTACLTPESECQFFFHSPGAFDFAQIEQMTQERSATASAIAAADLQFRDLDPFDAAATVWGDPDSGPFGTIVRLDAGSDTGKLAQRNAVTLVPLTGAVELDDGTGAAALGIGSLAEAGANAPHTLSCEGSEDCLVYLFADGALVIRS